MSIVTLIRGLVIAVVVSIAAILAGCSTIINGTRQDVAVTSTPSGASVYVDNKNVGVTPFVASLKRGETYRLEVRRGDRPNEGLVTSRRLSKWFWANLPVWPGFIVDVID